MTKDFTFIPDNPIKKEEDDILNYSFFAERISNALLAIPDEGKFVFALCGEWGTGKTSILNLTQNKLSKGKFIIIHFSPWNITNKNILLKEFFTTLKNNLPIEKDKPKLYKLLDKYQDLLINDTKNIPKIGQWISCFFDLVISIFIKQNKKNDSITLQKQLIIDYLRNAKISKKIIIIMDDLDRLTKEEILLVFRLIKEIADFPKISYVLSFDKKQVSEAIHQLQNCDGSEYLKKFIHLQWSVPIPNEEKLFEVLQKQLDKNKIVFSSYQEKVYFEKAYKTCISSFINNIRDIKLLCNSFIFSYKIIGNEVNISDLLTITACSIFYPKLFNYIKTNKAILLGLDNSYFTKSYLKTLGGKTEEVSNEVLDTFKKYFSEEDDNFELVKKIVFFLFPTFAYLCDAGSLSKEGDIDSRNLLQSRLSFSKYFKQILTENDVSMLDINRFLYNDEEENAIAYILELCKKEFTYSNFISIIDERVLYLDETRIKIVFIALLNGAQVVKGYEQNNSGFKFSLFNRTTQICTTILYKLQKENSNKFLRELCLTGKVLNIYKGISDILLNQYYAFENKNLDYQAISKEDFDELCNLFFSSIENSNINYELIDDSGKSDLLYLYHYLKPEYITKHFAKTFTLPQNFVKLIFALSGTWFSKTDREISIEQLWKDSFPELPCLQESEKYIHEVLNSPVYKTLNDEEKKELARYCSHFSIETEGCHSYEDILIAWEKKYK